MKKPTITKEELIIANAKLQKDLETLSNSDVRRRKEFAKAFVWYKSGGGYGGWNNEREVQEPTWEQIFVNVGHLLAQRDFRNYEGNISEMECAIEDLKKWRESKKDQLL